MSRTRMILTTAVAAVIAVVAFGAYLSPADNSVAGDPAAIEADLVNTERLPTPQRTAAPQTASSRVDALPVQARDVASPLLTANQPPRQIPKLHPVGLAIDRLDVNAPVIATGVDEETGQMAVPSNVREVAWYEFGPSPGGQGSAVMAAHVDLETQGPGVFFNLRTLDPGDRLTVTYEDGSVHGFTVEARVIYEKSELPLDAIFSRSGDPVLTLITCGGGFNETARSYDSNVVVYAQPDQRPDAAPAVR